MIELSSGRKNKICLTDYDFRRDIENRLIMAQFSTLDLDVLEEIIYSSLTISIKKLADNLDIEESKLRPILEKLSKTGLLTFEKDLITVDKEMRKYYEAQILKFDEDFTPGMEFLQGLLKKVPIQFLPAWYSIPRTSNNIFDSLIEKYLNSPLTFQRYLNELNFGDPHLTGILQDVNNAPDFKLYSQELIEKYGLTREQFEEYLLHLEFNFVCCLGYEKVNDHWKEVVTPFHEWREYLQFLRDTDATTIEKVSSIVRTRPQDFAFIQDLAAILLLAKKQPIAISYLKDDKIVLEKSSLDLVTSKIEGLKAGDPFTQKYLQQLIDKLRMLHLAEVVGTHLYALEGANDWLDMRMDNRALYIYRHPENRILSPDVSLEIATERAIREAEKSIKRVLYSGWVYFDDFFKGVIVPLTDESMVTLKKVGKSWKYVLPQYSEDEKSLIRAIIFEWLFETGVVATGTHEGKPCFCATTFGQSLFAR